MSSPLSQTGFFFKRSTLSVLVVHANPNVGNQLRQALTTLGFGNISATSTHVQGLERYRNRKFQLVLVDAKDSDMPVLEFIRQAIQMDEQATLVAVSGAPQLDDVFGLLRAGARSYIVTPFTAEGLESVLCRAAEGAPLSEAILNATDRNGALVGLVLNLLYRVSVLMRQAREFSTAAREVESYTRQFAESIELARLFAEGGDAQLREKIIETCIGRANVAASRLGRTRKRLQNQRKPDPSETGSPAN